MRKFSKVPCPRIVTLDLLQSLLDVEDNHLITEIFLPDLYYYFNEIAVLPELERLGLSSKQEGYICQGKHEIMKRYKPVYPASRYDHLSRPVYIKGPQGVLADIVDEILLTYVYSWMWALKKTEDFGNCNQLSSLTPALIFKSRVHGLAPVAVLQKSKVGITLTLGTMVPNQMPKWLTPNFPSKSHKINVKKASKVLSKKFDEELANRMRTTDFFRRHKLRGL